MAHGYGQYCPVALASEILAERWTLLVVVALTDGVERFADLQRALPRISPTLLTKRLRTLEDAGVIEMVSEDGIGKYRLTDAGRELEPILMAIGRWGQRWARDLVEDDLDPAFLVWSMHLRLDVERMPEERTVIELRFSGTPKGFEHFWLVIDGGSVDMCVKPPGYEPNILVSSDIRRFVECWRGFRSLRGEIRAGRIRVRGEAKHCRAFPEWLLLSALAGERMKSGRERRLYLDRST